MIKSFFGYGVKDGKRYLVCGLFGVKSERFLTIGYYENEPEFEFKFLPKLESTKDLSEVIKEKYALQWFQLYVADATYNTFIDHCKKFYKEEEF